ncbi:pyridoxal-phosphate dependent enzyme [Longispora urticae]
MTQVRAAALHDPTLPAHGIDVFAAADDLLGHAVRTPVRRLSWLERIVGVPVWAKLESQQHTGSFKYRGAYLAVLRGPQRPVIAASAGNHGLAVAEVARLLGREVNICVPVTSSRLKRERILATGAGLVEYGNALDEATAHARGLAEAHDLHFISPYNNADVIAGASTIALEFLDEVGDLATLVAPMGGGGLVSGLALGAAAAGAPVRLFGCEPERYASVTASLAADEVTQVLHQPTFADGLAVNLDPGSITFPILREYLADTVVLSEEELAAATYALLVHESILVEPAGAAAVIACLRLAAQGRLTGPVGIPLCGGNLHHSTLSRIHRFPFTDPDLIRLLDLRGRAVADLPVRITRPMREAPDPVEAPGSALAAQRTDLLTQLGTVRLDLLSARQEIDEHTEYCAQNLLAVEGSVVARLREATDATVQRITAERVAVEAGADRDPADTLAGGEVILRYGLATLSYVRGAMEWCSPSYAQSRAVQFFDTGAQDSPGVNYERYEHASCHGIETQLLEVLGLAPDQRGLSVTSSGMAAYSLIEAFLLRARLRPGDTVLLAPYIYFEAAEQLTALPSVRIAHAPGYSVEEILAGVREHRPRCLFVDPVANTAQQRMIDIPRLLAELRSVVTHRTTVVIDGTMVSGALPDAALASDDLVEVLYYESCSKYLQLGLDAGMAGLVAYPVRLRPHFERLRRNLGAILYRHHAQLFPRFDRAFFQRRMRRISANALYVAETLHADERVRELGQVCYPGLGDHPDLAIARTLPYAGGCVTFSFHEAGRNHRDELEPLIDHMLATARRSHLHLTKGVSFGFSVPRVSAASSMAETEPPFLRLYTGDRGGEQVALLAAAVSRALVG